MDILCRLYPYWRVLASDPIGLMVTLVIAAADLFLEWVGFQEQTRPPMFGLAVSMLMLQESLPPVGEYAGFALMLMAGLYAARLMRRGWSPFHRNGLGDTA